MKHTNNASNVNQKNMASRTKKIAAIAGLTMTAGMVLSEISPVVVEAAVAPNLESTSNQVPESIVNVGKGFSIMTLFPKGDLHIGEGKLINKSLSEILPIKPSEIRSISIDGKVIANNDSSNLFSNLPKLNNIIGLENLDTSEVTTMDRMFENDGSLSRLNIASLNVGNVTSMKNMFSNTSINMLDFSSWICNPNLNTENIFKDSPINGLKIPKTMILTNTGLKKSLNQSSGLEDAWFESSSNIPLQDSKILTVENIEKNHSKNNIGRASSYTRQNGEFVTQLVTFYIHKNGKMSTITSPVTGKIKTQMYINTPTISGYSKSKDKILITFNKDNAMAHPGEIIYYKALSSSNTNNNSIPSNENSSNDKGPSSNNSEKPTILVNRVHRKITIHTSKKLASLFNSKFELLPSRQLSAGSEWFSDKEMVKDGKTYYRVSTDEWVQAEDSYEYSENKAVITMKNDSNKSLVNSRGQKVENRSLAKGTAWQTDRTIKINGKLYHRVSTNEFVAASDVQA